MFKWLKTIIFGEPTGERARDKKGRYVADDKSTPNVNEAYKDGRKKSTSLETGTELVIHYGRATPQRS